MLFQFCIFPIITTKCTCCQYELYSSDMYIKYETQGLKFSEELWVILGLLVERQTIRKWVSKNKCCFLCPT